MAAGRAFTEAGRRDIGGTPMTSHRRPPLVEPPLGDGGPPRQAPRRRDLEGPATETCRSGGFFGPVAPPEAGFRSTGERVSGHVARRAAGSAA